MADESLDVAAAWAGVATSGTSAGTAEGTGAPSAALSESTETVHRVEAEACVAAAPAAGECTLAKAMNIQRVNWGLHIKSPIAVREVKDGSDFNQETTLLVVSDCHLSPGAQEFGVKQEAGQAEESHRTVSQTAKLITIIFFA